MTKSGGRPPPRFGGDSKAAVGHPGYVNNRAAANTLSA